MFEEPEQQIEEDQSVGAQIINKEMQLFETAKKRTKNLEKIYRILLTSRPTLKLERAFYAMGFLLPRLETDQMMTV